LKRLAAIFCLSVLGALVAVSVADSFPARFGERYLQPPCCNGEPLQGTAASLYVSSYSPDSYCVLHASDAGNQAATYGIKVGLLWLDEEWNFLTVSQGC
jgi:hypothetical protein